MGAGVAGPVLVVEDDPSIRQLLCDALEQDGLEVMSAGDGADALRLAERRQPAAVVLDMGLPFVDGAEVAGRIRDAYGDLVPFVVVTASRRIAAAASRIRAARYLTKPSTSPTSSGRCAPRSTSCPTRARWRGRSRSSRVRGGADGRMVVRAPLAGRSSRW